MRCIIHDWYDAIYKLFFYRGLMRSCCAAAESTTTQLLTTRPTVTDDVTTSEFVTVATTDSVVTTAAANGTVFFVNEQYGFCLGVRRKYSEAEMLERDFADGLAPFSDVQTRAPCNFVGFGRRNYSVLDNLVFGLICTDSAQAVTVKTHVRAMSLLRSEDKFIASMCASIGFDRLAKLPKSIPATVVAAQTLITVRIGLNICHSKHSEVLNSTELN